jgi:hypothetical protein
VILRKPVIFIPTMAQWYSAQLERLRTRVQLPAPSTAFIRLLPRENPFGSTELLEKTSFIYFGIFYAIISPIYRHLCNPRHARYPSRDLKEPTGATELARPDRSHRPRPQLENCNEPVESDPPKTRHHHPLSWHIGIVSGSHHRGSGFNSRHSQFDLLCKYHVNNFLHHIPCAVRHLLPFFIIFLIDFCSFHVRLFILMHSIDATLYPPCRNAIFLFSLLQRRLRPSPPPTQPSSARFCNYLCVCHVLTCKNVSGPARDRTRNLGVSSQPRCRLRYTALLLPGAQRDGLHPKDLLASDLGRNREVGSHGRHLEVSGSFCDFLPLSTPCCHIILQFYCNPVTLLALFSRHCLRAVWLSTILVTVFYIFVCTPTQRRKPLDPVGSKCNKRF